MKLSFSAISTYKNCPLSYKFMYVDKLPTKRTPVLSFGTSLHAALEKFYAVTVPKPPSLEELLGHLTQTWEKAGYSSDAEEQQYFEHAKQVLTNFYHSNASQFQIPAAVEQRFEVELDGHVLRGIIDRLDKLPAGGYEIIDYKTGRNIPPKYRVDSDLQLSIYYLASKELWGIEPEILLDPWPRTSLRTELTEPSKLGKIPSALGVTFKIAAPCSNTNFLKKRLRVESLARI